MNCATHRNRRATHYCQKTRTYLCAECATCRAPKRYCEHRSGCLIWNQEAETDGGEGAAG